MLALLAFGINLPSAFINFKTIIRKMIVLEIIKKISVGTPIIHMVFTNILLDVLTIIIYY